MRRFSAARRDCYGHGRPIRLGGWHVQELPQPQMCEDEGRHSGFGPEPDSFAVEHVLSCHNIVLRYLMRANPSPIAALHRIDSEAVGFDQLEKPVLSAGNPFLRAF